MRICIPTEEDRGLSSRARARVGGAPYYALIDTETGHVQIVRNTHRRHDRGDPGPGAHIHDLEADAVVCSEIGRRAFVSLENAGVDVYVSDSHTVAEFLSDLREGHLKRLSAEDVPPRRGQGQGHGHGRRARRD